MIFMGYELNICLKKKSASLEGLAFDSPELLTLWWCGGSCAMASVLEDAIYYDVAREEVKVLDRNDYFAVKNTLRDYVDRAKDSKVRHMEYLKNTSNEDVIYELYQTLGELNEQISQLENLYAFWLNLEYVVCDNDDVDVVLL